MDHRIHDRGGASRELEIKFEIDPRRLGELHGSLMLHGVSEPPIRLLSTYLDTDDHTLHPAQRRVQLAHSQGGRSADPDGQGFRARPEIG